MSRLTNQDVAAIAVALLGPEAAEAGLTSDPRHAVALELLSLPFNRLSDEQEDGSSSHLAPLAALVCASMRVDLRHNDLGPAAVAAMLGPLDPGADASGPEAPGAASDAASGLSHVQELSLDGNPIGDEGALCLAAALPRLSGLQCLGLEGCRLGSKGLIAVAAALQAGSCPDLLELRAGDALLGAAAGWGREQDAVYRLARGVRDGAPKLEVLSLRRIPTATAYAAATLASHLEEHQGLTVIDLCGCRLAGEGAAAMARLSVVNERVEEFGLRATGAGDEGAMAWAAAIRGGSGAAVLDLRQCRIGDEGLTELLAAVGEAAEAGRPVPARLLLWGNAWLEAPSARRELLSLVEAGIASPRPEMAEEAMLVDCEPTVVDGEVQIAHSPFD